MNKNSVIAIIFLIILICVGYYVFTKFRTPTLAPELPQPPAPPIPGTLQNQPTQTLPEIQTSSTPTLEIPSTQTLQTPSTPTVPEE